QRAGVPPPVGTAHRPAAPACRAADVDQGNRGSGFDAVLQHVPVGGVERRGGFAVTWQLRVAHRTGYRYATPATQSYNEARLTPRSDRRQTTVATRIETTPATRAYRYTDYWGTVVTSFDLHAPHTEFTVLATSVVETADAAEPIRTATWKDLRGETV